MYSRKIKPRILQFYGIAIFIRRIYSSTQRTQVALWELLTGSPLVRVHFLCRLDAQRF